MLEHLTFCIDKSLEYVWKFLNHDTFLENSIYSEKGGPFSLKSFLGISISRYGMANIPP